tara:strand:+ start:206 stop:430 length:225 start_codon:yes stop_codon:yes gene_type:complete
MASYTWTNPRVLLMRKTKKQLQEMCDQKGITYPEKHYKSDLVDRLCPPEDGKRATNALFKALGAGPVHPEVEDE